MLEREKGIMKMRVEKERPGEYVGMECKEKERGYKYIYS